MVLVITTFLAAIPHDRLSPLQACLCLLSGVHVHQNALARGQRQASIQRQGHLPWCQPEAVSPEQVHQGGRDLLHCKAVCHARSRPLACSACWHE